MQVRATKLGYYDLKRKKEGEVFVIKDASHFSDKWMESLAEAKDTEPPAPRRGRGSHKYAEEKSSENEVI